MQKLNQFLARLQKLSEEFNLAVLLINQVQADPGVRADGFKIELTVRRVACELLDQ